MPVTFNGKRYALVELDEYVALRALRRAVERSTDPRQFPPVAPIDTKRGLVFLYADDFYRVAVILDQCKHWPL